MHLKNHYDQLFNSSFQKIQSDDCEIDPLIHSPFDKRLGITLLLRPSEEVKKNIQNFMGHLKQYDPDQYYYPNSDIHITVLSIISCYEGFQLSQINVKEYIHLIQQSLQNISPFIIKMIGISLSPNAIMIQGFPQTGHLQTIRERVRKMFKASSLEQSLDSRYILQTAHSTVVRFENQLRQKHEFLKELKKCRKTEFGSFKVHHLELVYNDWYQKKEKVKLLQKFIL